MLGITFSYFHSFSVPCNCFPVPPWVKEACLCYFDPWLFFGCFLLTYKSLRSFHPHHPLSSLPCPDEPLLPYTSPQSWISVACKLGGAQVAYGKWLQYWRKGLPTSPSSINCQQPLREGWTSWAHLHPWRNVDRLSLVQGNTATSSTWVQWLCLAQNIVFCSSSPHHLALEFFLPPRPWGFLNF